MVQISHGLSLMETDGEAVGLKPWSGFMKGQTKGNKNGSFLCTVCRDIHVPGPGQVCGPCHGTRHGV